MNINNFDVEIFFPNSYYYFCKKKIRLERLNIGTLTGKAKIVGTLLGISGAMILTFYKSIEIHLWSTHINLLKHQQPKNVSADNILGSSLALGTCISYSIWLIIQVTPNSFHIWIGYYFYMNV